MFLITGSAGVYIFDVKSTFEMSTVREHSIHFRHTNGCSCVSVKFFEIENVSTWEGLESPTFGYHITSHVTSPCKMQQQHNINTLAYISININSDITHAKNCNHFSYQGQTFVVPCFWILAILSVDAHVCHNFNGDLIKLVIASQTMQWMW